MFIGVLKPARCAKSFPATQLDIGPATVQGSNIPPTPTNPPLCCILHVLLPSFVKGRFAYFMYQPGYGIGASDGLMFFFFLSHFINFIPVHPSPLWLAIGKP